MPQKPDFTLRIGLRNIEDFSPDAIARSPRNFRPADLINACNNLIIEPAGKQPEIHMISIAKFVAVDFFALAHGTGLYNRQARLWEGLAKIASVEVFLNRKGFFKKIELPEFDMVFLDSKGRTICVAHYTAPERAGAPHDFLASFKEFVKRMKLRQGRQAVMGVFCCYEAPFPERVRDYIAKETGANDPVRKYESVLPALDVPINVLEIDADVRVYSASERTRAVRLLLPDLTKKKSWSATRDPAEATATEAGYSPLEESEVPERDTAEITE